MALEYRAKASDFGAWLDRNAGKVGYLIGTRGQTCTQSMIDTRLSSAAYETYWNAIRAYASQWLGKVVADCMGVYEMFLNGGEWDRPLSLWKYPDTNTGMMYSLARSLGLPNGTINTLPKDCPYPIAVCYSGHVGFFYRGKIYQSSGHRYGLEITELTSTAHNHAWTNWYYLPYLDYSGEVTYMLYLGCPAGETVKRWQESLTRCMGVGFEIDGVGNYGNQTYNSTTAFQKAVGLKQTGQVDDMTYARMLAELLSISVAPGIPQADYDAALRSIDELSGQLTAQIGINANTSAELANLQALYDTETQISADWAAKATAANSELADVAEACKVLAGIAKKY